MNHNNAHLLMHLNDAKISNIGLVLLAAGSSSRLGRAKQLLDWHGKSLLQHSLDQSEGLALSQRLIVYGARKSVMENHLKNLEVPFTYNINWSEGMGSSIKTGVEKMLGLQPKIEAILFCLVDQPLIKKAQLEMLLALHNSHPENIISATYQNTFGVPTIFPKAFFKDLLNLKNQAGAKKIIRKYQNQVIPFPCPEAAFDIDTEADYTHLLKQ